MKKTTLLTFAVLTILTLNDAYSQRKEIKSSIKFNAITVFKQVYDVQYEKVLNSRNSLQFGIGIGNYSDNDVNKVQELHLENFGTTLNIPKDAFISEKTFSINIDYRHYYMESNKAPRGLYISPSIQYLKSDHTFSALEQSYSAVNGAFAFTKREYSQNLSILNFRALIGCQIIIADFICFNPYCGPSYAFGSANNYNSKEDSKAKGLIFNYGVFLGIAF